MVVRVLPRKRAQIPALRALIVDRSGVPEEFKWQRLE